MFTGIRLNYLSIISLICLMLLTACDCSVSPIPFDSAKWKEGIFIDQPGKSRDKVIAETRHAMCRDLCTNHLKSTMMEDDVKKMLGSPDEVFSRDRIVTPAPDVMKYWSYDIEAGCIDCVHLLIGFDSKGMCCFSRVNGM